MNLKSESQEALQKLLLKMPLDKCDDFTKRLFKERLDQHFDPLFTLLSEIYGHREDFYHHIQQLLGELLTALSERSEKLHQKDEQRLSKPNWFLQEDRVGMTAYVDLFGGDLSGLINRIPYLKSLGITYLHLMPLYESPKGESDGGYAVSDYRTVNAKLGTTQDLRELALALENAGISLVLDFVFNHTSNEHKWAQAAIEGDKYYQDFYHLFDDREQPDHYDKTLREIFPQIRRGCFSWHEPIQKWVWTTFNSFQWDLNYNNPSVFNAITSEMLFLANIGTEALRLDAISFIWKEEGTNCEGLPFAHLIIQALNLCTKIAAPSLLFKSEAIVHPKDVAKYISHEECQLSYNPLLMELLWSSLATGETQLLTASMQESFSINEGTSWVNYTRCHDDIGWTFDKEVAEKVGVNGFDHTLSVSQFLTGKKDKSFATGVSFFENHETGDFRICGSLASLAGLEQAIEENDAHKAQLAVNRILLLQGITFSIGGIPLIYSGDELGLVNDYSFEEDTNKKHDSRWVHRLSVNESDIEKANNPKYIEYQINTGLKKIIKARQSHKVFGEAKTHILDADNPHIFAYLREHKNGDKLLCVANFNQSEQPLSLATLHHLGYSQAEDLMTNQVLDISSTGLKLAPYQLLWLKSL